MRQVDDFAVAVPTQQLAESLLDNLDNLLVKPIKKQGVLLHYNGVDVLQTKDYVKISVETYFRSIFQKYGWTEKVHKMPPTKMIPLTADNSAIKELESTLGPNDDAARAQLVTEMGFEYCATIGELVYAMVTCQPDISFAVTKLSQYSVRPAQCHITSV